MSIVYISGGMAGYDGLNEAAFRAAAQLYEAFPHPTSVAGAWGGLPREHRERWRRVADVAIRWFGEQTAS